MMVEGTQLAAFLMGTLAPLIVAVVVMPHWADELRMLASYGVYLVIAAALEFLEGGLTWTGDTRVDIANNFAIIALTAFTAFKGFWEPRGVTQKIEGKTTASNAPVEPEDGSEPPDLPARI